VLQALSGGLLHVSFFCEADIFVYDERQLELSTVDQAQCNNRLSYQMVLGMGRFVIAHACRSTPRTRWRQHERLNLKIQSELGGFPAAATRCTYEDDIWHGEAHHRFCVPNFNPT